FLTDVQVAEAADLGDRVRLRGFLLEAPPQQHVAHHLTELLARQPLHALLRVQVGFALLLPRRILRRGLRRRGKIVRSGTVRLALLRLRVSHVISRCLCAPPGRPHAFVRPVLGRSVRRTARSDYRPPIWTRRRGAAFEARCRRASASTGSISTSPSTSASRISVILPTPPATV